MKLTGSLLLAGALCHAVTLGQRDTFEDGTTQNWVNNLLGMGVGAPAPVNEPTGGPGGVDDNWLRLTAIGGVAAGSRLSVINFMSQWAGNYLAAGVGAISLDVNNLGDTELSLRLLIADPVAGPPTNEAISTVPVVVPAMSGWMSVVFRIGPGNLTAVNGSVALALMNATELRIYHSPNLTLPPPVVVASLGVDNITATPEPAMYLMTGLGLLAFGLMRRPG